MRYAGCGIGVLLAILVLVAIFTYRQREAPLTNVPVEAPTGEFIGSAACQSCHADQHGSWHDSYHRTMTQLATESSVLGDFNEVRLAGKDLDVRLFKEKGKFLVEMKLHNPESTNLYSVVMTTGSHNRQAYWLSDPNDSQLKILPYMYLRAEQRWDAIPGGEPRDVFHARTQSAFLRIVAAHPDGRVVVVAHGGVIGQLLHHAAGSQPFAFLGADNASISEIVVTAEGQQIVRRFNDASHLDDLYA